MVPNVVTAVFPAAGLGTRFLPATKAQPKEMLALVDKPLIQYGVEEAIQSGIENIIIVTGRGKAAIEDHFDMSFELEHLLESKHKTNLLKVVRGIADNVDVCYIRQKVARGLGDAVLRARHLVGNQAFAVILADDIVDTAEGQAPCLRQLLDAYHERNSPVVAVMEVPQEDTDKYGIVAYTSVAGTDDRLLEIHSIVEKPKTSEAPSRTAVIGRYVLTPDIFDELSKTAPGAGDEIQLTDALGRLLAVRKVYGYRFEGTRYDAGDKLGFLKATVELALRRQDSVGKSFLEYLRSEEFQKRLSRLPFP